MDINKRRELINSLGKNGKILSVSFIKKNGEKRNLVGRLGVKKYLKGGISTTNHIDKYITIFDLSINNYRNINLETLTTVKGCGKEFTF